MSDNMYSVMYMTGQLTLFVRGVSSLELLG